MTATRYGHLTDAELLREGLSREMDEYAVELYDRLARIIGRLDRAEHQRKEDD